MSASPASATDDRERSFDEQVARSLPRNVAAQLFNGMFGQTGFRLVQAPTFLPAYLHALSGSDVVVGLARSLQAAGTVLSPVIGASLIGHRGSILGISLGLGALMRLNILGIALAGFLLGAGEAIYAVLVMLTLMGFFQGASQVTMNSLRAKVIPVQRRGIVAGMRNLLAGIASASVSYVAGAYVIERNLLGNGYASVFLLAFAIGMIGLAGLGFTREPVTVSVRAQESVRGTIARLPALLRENPDFARFFVARAIGSFGRMAMPFYILFAGTRMELTGASLGLLTSIWMVTSSMTNLVWGVLADRRGYRVVMIATLAIWIVANAQLLFTSDVSGMVAFFVTMGMAQGGFNQSGQNMVLEFGRTEDIPIRLAASSTAVNFVGTIGPLLGGAIAALWSYHALFVTCIVLQSIALAIIVVWVPEPRLASLAVRGAVASGDD